LLLDPVVGLVAPVVAVQLVPESRGRRGTLRIGSALAAGLSILPFAVGAFLGTSVSHGLGRRVRHLGSGLFVVGIAGLIATIHQVGVDVSALKPSRS
jgi:hypothetical protein